MWGDILHADQQLLLLLNGSWGNLCDSFFYAVSGRLTWTPLYVAIIYGLFRKLGRRGGVCALLMLIALVLVSDHWCNLFKIFLPKLRPTHTPEIEAWVHTVRGYRGGLYGTLSAHTAISFAIARFSSLLIQRRWYTVVIFAWAALVAYSRIYLGVHYPLDLLFGGVSGWCLGYLGWRLFPRLLTLKCPRKGSCNTKGDQKPQSNPHE